MACSIVHDIILITRAPFMAICTVSLIIQVKSPHIPNGMVYTCNIEDVLILSLKPLVSTLRYWHIHSFGALWSLWWGDHQATCHHPYEGHALLTLRSIWHSYIQLCSALYVCSPLTGNTIDLEEYTWQTVCAPCETTHTHTHRLAKGMIDFLKSQDGASSTTVTSCSAILFSSSYTP